MLRDRKHSTSVYMCSYTCIQYIHTYVHTWFHTHIHLKVRTFQKRLCMYVCIYVYIHTHTYIHSYEYTRTKACQHVYVLIYHGAFQCQHKYQTFHQYSCIHTHTYICEYDMHTKSRIFIDDVHVHTYTRITHMCTHIFPKISVALHIAKITSISHTQTMSNIRILINWVFELP